MSSYSGIRGGAAAASKSGDSDGPLLFESAVLICTSNSIRPTTEMQPPIPSCLRRRRGRSAQLRDLVLKQFDFAPQHPPDPVFGEIDRPHARAHALSYLFHRQVLQDVEIEHLVLLGADLSFDALGCRFEKICLPLLVPDRFQIAPGGIIYFFERRGSRIIPFR